MDGFVVKNAKDVGLFAFVAFLQDKVDVVICLGEFVKAKSIKPIKQWKLAKRLDRDRAETVSRNVFENWVVVREGVMYLLNLLNEFVGDVFTERFDRVVKIYSHLYWRF